MNDRFIVEGGHRLSGEITPQGAKNEALQVICATLLTEDEVRISNIPEILDIMNLIGLLEGMGVSVTRHARGVFSFRADHIDTAYIESDEFVLDVLIVGHFQRLHGRGILSHSAPHVGTGRNHDHVAAHLGDVGLYAALAALADGKHGDDRGHADDDAESREEGAHLVGEDGPNGYFEKIGIIHVVECFGRFRLPDFGSPSAVAVLNSSFIRVGREGCEAFCRTEDIVIVFVADDVAVAELNVALYTEGNDSQYTDCVMVDYTVGLRATAGANRFTRLHAWGGMVPPKPGEKVGEMLVKSICFQIPGHLNTLKDCYADTGWIGFDIGVCFPSLGITAGARRLATKSSACLRMVAKPFSAI